MYICIGNVAKQKLIKMKNTKETIRQSYSIKISNALFTIYGNTEAYINEFKKSLTNINRVAKKSKKENLEFELQEMLLNCTR